MIGIGIFEIDFQTGECKASTSCIKAKITSASDVMGFRAPEEVFVMDQDGGAQCAGLAVAERPFAAIAVGHACIAV
jgi:hypothetical protein